MSFESKTVFLRSVRRSSFHTFVAGRILRSNSKFIRKSPLGREKQTKNNCCVEQRHVHQKCANFSCCSFHFLSTCFRVLMIAIGFWCLCLVDEMEWSPVWNLLFRSSLLAQTLRKEDRVLLSQHDLIHRQRVSRRNGFRNSLWKNYMHQPSIKERYIVSLEIYTNLQTWGP